MKVTMNVVRKQFVNKQGEVVPYFGYFVNVNGIEIRFYGISRYREMPPMQSPTVRFNLGVVLLARRARSGPSIS